MRFRPCPPACATEIDHALPCPTTPDPSTGQASANPPGETTNQAPRRTRKRPRNPENWKHNKRQRLKEAGEEYVSVRKKVALAKKIKDLKACEEKCKFKCKSKISQLEREALHQSFKTLDFTEKHAFILSTSECFDKASKKESRRSKSYTYSFLVQGHKIRVCKDYYLGTLSVSQKMVYGSHLKKNDITGTPKADGRGKHAKKRISDEDRDHVIDHINSFPRVESHYCRSSTKKEYLDSGLNLQKMYDLYVESCTAQGLCPVKMSFYRYIFNYQFNLEFHQRKTDRCDDCERFKVAGEQNLLTEKDKEDHLQHIKNKNAMRKAVEEDKTDKNINILVSFDLQNVISLPRADISSFFYKRKLTVYNLTGQTIDHQRSKKEGYCVIWPENMSGRAGNDIASAFIRFLEKMTEGREDIRHITTWSDSCVPQNRNRMISYAIFHFLNTHPNIESVTMKFSVPGHSCVQSVDNMHSQIEKALMSNEVFSPVSLMRVLKKVNNRNPFHIIQMRPQDFKDFKSPADLFQFENVPFSRVSVLRFTKEPTVSFKLNHYEEFQTVSLRKAIKTRKASKQTTPPTHLFLPQPKVTSASVKISKEKESDIKSMLHFMSAIDKAYYTAVFNSS